MENARRKTGEPPTLLSSAALRNPGPSSFAGL